MILFLLSLSFWAAASEFSMDPHQVTRSQYLEFVREFPEWRRGNVSPLYAEPGYLRSWINRDQPNSPLSAPVTEVSWFAARAYCEWKGQALPTINQWELMAAANEASKDASKSGEFRQRILDWYGRPSSGPINSVMSGYKNVYGIWDLHGLVWEWNEDFNSVIIDPQACGASGDDKKSDRTDYANFMRFAFRSSLKGNTTVKNLGFRCVRNAKEEGK